MDEPPDPPVRFEVLGPLRAWRGDTAINLGPVQQRVVLAILLLHRHRPISLQQMINAVWGETEPRSATNLVHRYISGLRNVLEPGRKRHSTASQLVLSEAGYRLIVPDDCLDLAIFDRELHRARKKRAEGELATAAEILHSALALWRGPVCAGLSCPFLESECDRLTERRISVIEECAELDLAVGTRADLITELRQLVAEHPLREKLHALLMLALYRSGRRADALAAFQDIRRLLREELGVDPAAFLQELHQQILTADPALTPANVGSGLSDDTSSAGRRPPAPAQLPHGVPGFSGRAVEIAWLNELLPDEAGDAGRTMVITAIAGTGGVGKTALAVHWAHQIRHLFPDGQLYVNLRGFDPAGRAMQPAEAIRAFLDAFAVPPERIPVDINAQAALYRTLLSGQRILIILDNARDADQVRPLLPGSPTCLVVVTSRSHLLGLVAANGARLLDLDVLSIDEARFMLAARLGKDRVESEPAAVDQIIDSCARLPLALAIVSARASASPWLSLGDLAQDLRKTRSGLDALDGGDPHTDIRAVFSLSYRALTPPAARLFRLLGLHAGPDIGTSAAASLAGLPARETRALLAELVSAHLLTERRGGRFSFHDLLRAYAGELAEELDSQQVRRETVHRILDHYLRTAYHADALLWQRDDDITPAPAVPLVTPEHLIDHRQALTWFEAEYPALIAALRQAAGEGTEVYAWQLAWALTSFFSRRGHWRDAASSQQAALDAAKRLNDPYAEAKSRDGLAKAYSLVGRYDDARPHHLRALELYEELGDYVGIAHTHRCLAYILDKEGHYREALQHVERAAEMFRAGGHRIGYARALNAVGWFHVRLGNYDQGLKFCQQALDLQRVIGDKFSEAETLDSVASAQAHLGHHQEAIDHYKQAVQLYREFEDRKSEADVLTSLGDAYRAAGDFVAADETWRHALAIFQRLGLQEAAQVHERIDTLNAEGERSVS